MVKAKKKTKKKAKKQASVAKLPKPPRNNKGQLISGWGKGSKQVKKKLKAKKKKPARRANGTLLPGQPSLYPEGGKVGTSRLNALLTSIARVGTQHDKDFLDMLVERAYGDDTPMAIAILNRLLPSLKAIEMLTVSTDAMADKEAEAIRAKKQEEFKAIMGKNQRIP